MSTLLGGLDIGGTKCAAVLGRAEGDRIEIVGKRSFPTPDTPEEAMASLCGELAGLAASAGGGEPLAAVGVSCGGPLDSRRGRILSPPNLPGWDGIDVLTPLRERFGVPAALQNDANACALAEWRWGAGRGASSMIFLTFGTGMGAGLILNGALYAGASDMAGEVGHIRLAEEGPVGYGKAGSFEGFCSGGGIARLFAGLKEAAAETAARSSAGAGGPAPQSGGSGEAAWTAKDVFEAAAAGDALARHAVGIIGRKLGRGLAVLVDTLNPERIVIGSIYARQEQVLRPLVLEELRREALPGTLAACRILPSELGEHVGDAASLSVALHALGEHERGNN